MSRRPAPRGLPIAGPAHPPPFRLTAGHFATALLWLLIGGVGLVAVSADLAAGNFLAPHVLAVTHLFTLGVLTTTIYGALYQFFPGALGIAIRSVRVAYWTWAAHTTGTLLLVAGFWTWHPALLGAGWILLFCGVFGSSWNLLPQRRRAPHGLVVGRYVSAGHIALGAAMLVALARVGNSLGLVADRPDGRDHESFPPRGLRLRGVHRGGGRELDAPDVPAGRARADLAAPLDRSGRNDRARAAHRRRAGRAGPS